MHSLALASRAPLALALALAVSLVVPCSACGGTATTESSTSPTAPPTMASADGGCGTVAEVATPVAIEAVASAPPQPRGGALVDGTYVLTGATLYTGPGGATGATGQTLAVAIEIAQGVAVSVSDGDSHAASIATRDSTITTTETCPGHRVETMGYTATGATIDAFIVEGPKTLVERFTRR